MNIMCDNLLWNIDRKEICIFFFLEKNNNFNWLRKIDGWTDRQTECLFG